MSASTFLFPQIFSYLHCGGCTVRQQCSERFQFENQPETTEVRGTQMGFCKVRGEISTPSPVQFAT